MRTEGTNSPPPDGAAGDLAPGAPRDATYGRPSANGPPPLADVAHPDDGPYDADPYDADPYDADPYEVARPAAPAGALPGDVTRYFVDFLSRATAFLGATLDQEAMLRGLARASVPVIGDWCFVDLVQPDGDLCRIAVAHAAAEDARLASPLSAAPPAHGPDPAAAAVRTRRTQLVPVVGPAWRVAIAPDAARLDALDRLGPRGWLAVPLVARGQVLGVLSFVMAASRRAFTPLVVAVAEELARRAALSADNARLYRQAVRASEAKSAFLGTISHELRTPLTAIIGYAELLQDGLAGPLAEPQAEFVRRIRESSDHLLRLVEEVLRYTRLQAQEEQPVLARVDVGALAEQSLAVVVPLAHRKGLALHLDRPDAPLWLDTDATKLRQILVNLLGNAVKFTDHGEVRVRVLPPRRDDDPVTLEVADTGIGIPAALLPHVFDPFWQAEQTTTRLRGGAGLGLSVARQLARLLGGELTAESEPGRGSRFRVRLPATAPRPE